MIEIKEKEIEMVKNFFNDNPKILTSYEVEKFVKNIPLKVDIDKVIDDLTNVYIDMCGLSMTYGSIVWDMMCAIVSYKQITDYHQQKEYIEDILDKKWIDHRDFDITYIEEPLNWIFGIFDEIEEKYYDSLYFAIFNDIKLRQIRNLK